MSTDHPSWRPRVLLTRSRTAIRTHLYDPQPGPVWKRDVPLFGCSYEGLQQNVGPPRTAKQVELVRL